ncbi:MAG: hypothetical protein Q8Q08_06650 [Candidatus Omnitrophota bacterium]|nr:hypothetical protein [Candidatus Omnitrophota bacterium]MDZ4242171.1 hypothetical protein [Candidatus Omnitrophota bacterium]
MIYIFLGEDEAAKSSRIDQIKKETLPDPDARSFDYEILYAPKLNPVTLKQSLIALPAIARKRLVLLKECHRLTEDNQAILASFAAASHEHLVLILESSRLEPGSPFVQRLKPYAKIIATQTAPEINVFTVTKAMEAGQPAQALKLLFEIMERGEKPVQILGGLVWFWSKKRALVPADVYQEGLRVLQETDLNVKRTRLRPEFALEEAVVKLGGLWFQSGTGFAGYRK